MNGQLPTHTRNFGTLPSSKYSYDANYLPLLPVLTADHTPQFSHSPENWFKAPLPAPPRPTPLLCHVFTNKTLSQSSHLHSAPGSHTATLDTLDNMDTLDPADTL